MKSKFSKILSRLVAEQTLAASVFVCFVALRLKSTAMVMVGWSVHLNTLFSLASLNKQLTSTSSTYFHL